MFNLSHGFRQRKRVREQFVLILIWQFRPGFHGHTDSAFKCSISGLRQCANRERKRQTCSATNFDTR